MEVVIIWLPTKTFVATIVVEVGGDRAPVHACPPPGHDASGLCDVDEARWARHPELIRAEIRDPEIPLAIVVVVGERRAHPVVVNPGAELGQDVVELALRVVEKLIEGVVVGEEEIDGAVLCPSRRGRGPRARGCAAGGLSPCSARSPGHRRCGRAAVSPAAGASPRCRGGRPR